MLSFIQPHMTTVTRHILLIKNENRLFDKFFKMGSAKAAGDDNKASSSDDDENLDNKLLDNLSEQYFKSKSQSTSTWLSYLETCYIYLYRGGGEPNSYIASFDLDGTIIKPKNPRHKIPRGATDWQFFSAWTKVCISNCTSKSPARRLVLFTNQNGVGLGFVPLSEIKSRIELVTKALNIPCIVFVAINKDNFRKPNTKMFWLFERSFNDSLKVDRQDSFYCGDAIGYPSHSDADIKFAQTLKLPFITPERYVRGHKPKAWSDASDISEENNIPSDKSNSSVTPKTESTTTNTTLPNSNENLLQ